MAFALSPVISIELVHLQPVTLIDLLGIVLGIPRGTHRVPREVLKYL